MNGLQGTSGVRFIQKAKLERDKEATDQCCVLIGSAEAKKQYMDVPLLER